MMLSRLMDVLMRKGASLDTATQFIALIENLSRLGPSHDFPHIVLGGGFVPTRDAIMPIYDPYEPGANAPRFDVEDGRVVDTAIAGNADALVTANFSDFVDRHDTVIFLGRVHIRHTAGHGLFLIQAKQMAEWLRSGNRPTPPA